LAKNNRDQLPQKILIEKLEDSGIKAVLNQNDIIEILAQERYNQILGEIDGFQKNLQLLISTKEEFRVQQRELFAQELIEAGLISDQQKTLLYVLDSQFQSDGKTWFENNQYGSIDIYTSGRHGNEIRVIGSGLELLTEDTLLSISLELRTSREEEKQHKGINIKCTTTETRKFKRVIKIPKSFVKKFNQALEEHCQRVRDFYTHYERTSLDLNVIIRETRVKFNKEILKSKAPEIKMKLKELFKINL
jgi:hypothetical protein